MCDHLISDIEWRLSIPTKVNKKRALLERALKGESSKGLVAVVLRLVWSVFALTPM